MDLFFIILAVILFDLWFIFSGSVEPFILSFGLVSSVFTSWLIKVAIYKHEKGRRGMHSHIRWRMLPAYCALLVRDALIASVAMLKKAWAIDIKPDNNLQEIQYNTSQINVMPNQREIAFGVAVLCSSITFTPGTISSAVSGNVILVSCYDKHMSDDLMAGKLQVKVQSIINIARQISV